MRFKIGCCGWGFFSAKEFFGVDWRERFKTRLQGYAELFNLVEVNSTFYKSPLERTALKWHEEATSINKDFEFTVKVNKVITHIDRFKTRESIKAFEKTLVIARTLKAKVLLLQTPKSFNPTQENIKNINRFFKAVKSLLKNETLVWEPRGDFLDSKELIKILKKHSIEHCVDPLRTKPVFSNKILYFRLHGFGKNMMYNYRFNKKELLMIKNKINDFIREFNPKQVYVLFNNYYMYDNALEFKRIIP